MRRKFLLLGSLLLLLMMGFALLPAHVAHADECTGPCGDDPVVDGCSNYQTPRFNQNFSVTNNDGSSSTWRIRLMVTGATPISACNYKAWASLILIQGNSYTINNSVDIQVYNMGQSDVLPSSSFQSGAYTNMITYVQDFSGAQYDGYDRRYNGNYIHPAAHTP